MGRISDTYANNLLDVAFGKSASSWPSVVYIGLSTTTPTNTGTNVTEPTGNGYARVAVPNDATHWPAASSRAKANGGPVTFTAATGSWGTITHFVMYDAASSGNFLAWGAVTSTPITTNDQASFATGQITITSPGA